MTARQAPSFLPGAALRGGAARISPASMVTPAPPGVARSRGSSSQRTEGVNQKFRVRTTRVPPSVGVASKWASKLL